MAHLQLIIIYMRTVLSGHDIRIDLCMLSMFIRIIWGIGLSFLSILTNSFGLVYRNHVGSLSYYSSSAFGLFLGVLVWFIIIYVQGQFNSFYLVIFVINIIHYHA